MGLKIVELSEPITIDVSFANKKANWDLLKAVQHAETNGQARRLSPGELLKIPLEKSKVEVLADLTGGGGTVKEYKETFLRKLLRLREKEKSENLPPLGHVGIGEKRALQHDDVMTPSQVVQDVKYVVYTNSEEERDLPPQTPSSPILITVYELLRTH